MMLADDATIVQFDVEYLEHLELNERLETANLQRTRESLDLAQGQWRLTRLYEQEITRSAAELKWLRARIREVKRYYL